jgi:hypothetical protein
MNKRHADPSQYVLCRRIDRKLNAMHKTLKKHCAVLAGHCERLVREKEDREKSSSTG